MLLAMGLALLLAVQIARAAPPEEESGLVFAAGRARGNYNALATAMAAELDKRGRRMEVRETGGSYDNAELLRDGKADLGLLQSDVAYLEHYNQRPFLALAPVYTEPIHVIAYRGLDLRRISDLIPHKDSQGPPLVVAVGAPGSGSSAHALAVLDELGLPPGRIQTVAQSADEAAWGLKNRTVDLAFLTSAVPSGVVKGLAAERIISLLDIDRDIAQRLRRRNPFFVAAEIPYGAYGASKRNVQTLGTLTLLVARPDLPAKDVDLTLDALYAVADRADDETLPFLQGLSPASAFDELAIPLHPEALRYHQERFGPYRRWVARLRHNALPLILLAAVVLALFRISRLAYFVHQFVLGRVLVSLLGVWLAGTAAMYLLEHRENSAFRTFYSSSIAILHYLFSGLESKYPVTTGGNVVAILILSLGVGVVTLFTATVVTLLVEHAMNIRTLRSKPAPFLKLSGHTVIAGWSDRTKRIIRQLRSRDLTNRPTVVVVASEAAATQVEDRKSFRGVWVVEGDRSQAATLRKADIATASRAVVLAAASPDGAQDLSSISCSLAIEHQAPAVHTIVEARDPTEVEILTRIQVDETLDTETLADRLISQCVITPGIAQIYDELLTFGAGSQEIYVLPIWAALDGLCFRQIRHRLRPCDTIALGFWRRGEQRPTLNPPAHDRKIPLRASGPKGDRLVVLADSPKDLNSYRARFKQWRHAMNESSSDAPAEPARPANAATAGAAVEPRATQRATRIGICGWNDESRAVVRQLQDKVIESHQRFEVTVIVGPRKSGIETPCTRNVHFVFGDPTRTAVLDNAGLRHLETLVVLADRSDAASARFSDHRALAICLAAREVNPEAHLVVEVLSSDNQEHFQRLTGVEIVSVEDLAEKLVAQAVISPGITRIYTHLLTATEDSNEIYVVPVPTRWEGLPFRQIAADLQNSERPAIALGYRTRQPDGRPAIVLNPQQRRSESQGVVSWREQPLGSGDSLVVMAYEEPTW
jgi:TRAP transporter TAXI family solute receptor